MAAEGTGRATTPRERSVDSTLALLTEGYSFLPRRFQQHQSDIFETRLMGQRAICLRGEHAARLFYDPERFQRSGAVPARVLKTLFGEGGVQVLDGDAHRHRKAMFMQSMTPDAIDDLVARIVDAWTEALAQWERAERIVLFDAVPVVLCQAACAWTGVPLARDEVWGRAADLVATVDGFAAVGPRYFRGRLARRRLEAWLGGIVRDVRKERLGVAETSPLHAVAFHRELDGALLTSRVAAVELLNLIRPTVAIAWYVVFMAVALEEHPEWRARIASGDDDVVERFVHEVRRFYPFVPMLGARTRTSFDWRGHHFDEGMLVILDVFGAHRDGRRWVDPGAFDPDRFRGWTSNGYDFIPQGGGDFHDDHRCAGEWATIAVMKAIARLLCEAMVYRVPEQDMRIRLRRMPALPESGLIISDVHMTTDAAASRAAPP